MENIDRMKRVFQVVPLLVGVLLLVAAVLKADGLLLEEKIQDGLLGSRIFLIGVVAGEFAMAAWLLSGVAARICRHVALALFTLFTVITLFKGLAGETSCGCFGRFEVNPWWTLLLDVSIVALLWFAHPTTDAPGTGATPVLGRMPNARPLWAAALCLLVAIPATSRMVGSGVSDLDAEGVIAGPGNLTILEPEKWLGQAMPISKHIDIGEKLAKGRWTVLFYHYDCPKCREALPRYERLAIMHADHPDSPQIALVEVPPYEPSLIMNDKPWSVTGQLSNRREWFVQAPLEITLEQGIVKNVSTELPSLANAKINTSVRVLASKSDHGMSDHADRAP